MEMFIAFTKAMVKVEPRYRSVLPREMILLFNENLNNKIALCFLPPTPVCFHHEIFLFRMNLLQSKRFEVENLHNIFYA